MTSSRTWGAFFDPHWGVRRKMAALPLPVAILGDLICGNRKWGHPRWPPEAEGPPFSSSLLNGDRKTRPILLTLFTCVVSVHLHIGWNCLRTYLLLLCCYKNGMPLFTVVKVTRGNTTKNGLDLPSKFNKCCSQDPVDVKKSLLIRVISWHWTRDDFIHRKQY